MASDFDFVIRNGLIVDGSGSEPWIGDLGVEGGKISEIGSNLCVGSDEFDATGNLVTPGFVDIHTHYDGQATWSNNLSPSSWHGVTTALMGNCGVGFAPVKEHQRSQLVELMEGVEDIPGVVLHEGLNWDWQSFPDYLDKLDGLEWDMDLGAQIPHGALRLFVMGERALNLEKATAQDIAAMRALVAEAMKAGALGLSTSRTLNHRSAKGDPTPSLKATEDELCGLALGLRDGGGGVLELISDFDTPDEATEFELLERVFKTSGQPISFSLSQRHRCPSAWRSLLHRANQAVEYGLEIKAQVAPRPIGILLGLRASFHPFSHLPIMREIADLKLEDRIAQMKREDFRALVLQQADENKSLAAPWANNFKMMFPLGDDIDYEPSFAKSIHQRASALGVSPESIAYQMMMERNGEAFLLAPFTNYAEYNLDHVEEMLLNKNTLFGLGDGGAHVGMICDSSFPTYLLSHWGRDRSGGRIPIQTLVKKLTWDNANAIGLRDRGILKPGMKADINVIDFENLNCLYPDIVHDLPAGGKRLTQKSRGYKLTMVSGVATYRDGMATGNLPGRLIRGRREL